MQNHEVSRIPPDHTSPLRQVCNRAPMAAIEIALKGNATAMLNNAN